MIISAAQTFDIRRIQIITLDLLCTE